MQFVNQKLLLNQPSMRFGQCFGLSQPKALLRSVPRPHQLLRQKVVQAALESGLFGQRKAETNARNIQNSCFIHYLSQELMLT
jgi:hypothetical protein